VRQQTGREQVVRTCSKPPLPRPNLSSQIKGRQSLRLLPFQVVTGSLKFRSLKFPLHPAYITRGPHRLTSVWPMG
jgi:hypothetical protein